MAARQGKSREPALANPRRASLGPEISTPPTESPAGFGLTWPLRLMLAFVVCWTGFTAWRLGSPDYSADEALFAVKAFEFWAKVEAGKWPGWNPVSDYLGPQDTWWAALVDWLHRKSHGAIPWNPAMMRLGPFALLCVASAALFRELQQRSGRLAMTWLVLTAFTPMVWVYGRVGWASAWGLGLMILVWQESLRAERTGHLRWWRLATWCGLSIWAHPNYLFGCAAAVLPRWTLIATALRTRQSTKIVGALLWGGLLTLPTVKNWAMSPPSGDSYGTWSDRARALLDVIGGRRPIEWQMVHDSGGTVMTTTIALLAVGLIVWRCVAGPTHRGRLTETAVALSLTLVLFAMAHGNRDLSVPGHERYLLALVPAWIWLCAEATECFFDRRRWSDTTLALALFGFSMMQGARLAEAVNRHAGSPPNLQQASDWLEARCPRQQCLALAEDFWDYWAFRFYSRDRYDLNVWGPNWRGAPVFARNGRELAGCWRGDSARPYRGPFREQRVFPGKGSASVTEICYTGVDGSAF